MGVGADRRRGARGSGHRAPGRRAGQGSGVAEHRDIGTGQGFVNHARGMMALVHAILGIRAPAGKRARPQGARAGDGASGGRWLGHCGQGAGTGWNGVSRLGSRRRAEGRREQQVGKTSRRSGHRGVGERQCGGPGPIDNGGLREEGPDVLSLRTPFADLSQASPAAVRDALLPAESLPTPLLPPIGVCTAAAPCGRTRSKWVGSAGAPGHGTDWTPAYASADRSHIAPATRVDGPPRPRSPRPGAQRTGTAAELLLALRCWSCASLR